MDALRQIFQNVRVSLWSTPGPPSKSATYFDLLDAFALAGCPVCALLEKGARKALDALFYEQVNDPVTRHRFLESHGLCNWHAWMLPDLPSSALGVALIYKHLLHETLGHMQVAPRDVRPAGCWRRVLSRLARRQRAPLPILAWRSKKRPCHLCAISGRLERDALHTIVESIAEPEFAEAFRSSPGLCLPHLYAATTIAQEHPNCDNLLALHAERWKALEQELEELVRKFDYRHADEVMGREGRSWLGALELFVGRAGVFGPERGEWPLRHTSAREDSLAKKLPTGDGSRSLSAAHEDARERC